MNIDKMTDEQKRVKIAEACGWKWLRRAEPLRNDLIRQESVGAYLKLGWVEIDHPKHEEFCDASTIPDYLNDLNAAFLLVAELEKDGWEPFIDRGDMEGDGAPWRVIFKYGQSSWYRQQSARNRSLAIAICDAFLLTLPEPARTDP